MSKRLDLSLVKPPAPVADKDAHRFMGIDKEGRAQDASERHQTSADGAERLRTSEDDHPERPRTCGSDGAGSDGAERLRTSGDVRKRPRTSGGSQVIRKNGTVRRRTTVYLEPEVARKLAAHCAAEGREMSHVVNAAIRDFLPTTAL